MSLPRLFLLTALLFAFAGMALGIHMGIAHDFAAAPVHAHINLVGWVTLALYGLIHRAYPAMGESRLAWVQFWVAEIGALIFPVGIAISIFHEQPLTAIVGSLFVIVGMLLFVVMAFRRLRD